MSTPLVSLIVNCDTRSQRDEQTGLFNGVVNIDFLTDGIRNKIKFFDGFDIETIVFIDEHNGLRDEPYSELCELADTLVIRKHTNEEKFNDNNYANALSLARGKYICHMDQDVCAFTKSTESVDHLLSLLSQYSYISYPSAWSPAPVEDHNYDYWWVSTRFFMCKRETLDITELRKCLADSDYLYGEYPASVRNPWTEHILGLMAKYNGNGVYYPPHDIYNYSIFTWENYEQYTIRRLNLLPYDEVKEYVIRAGGIFYPNNLKCI